LKSESPIIVFAFEDLLNTDCRTDNRAREALFDGIETPKKGRGDVLDSGAAT